MKQITLDIKRWRCGLIPGDEDYHMGNGPTSLLNFNRMQSFIGQFCSQLGVSNDALFLKCYPNRIEYSVFRNMLVPLILNEFHGCTIFTEECERINDCNDLSVKEKLTALTVLCFEQGYELVVLNEHLIPIF